MKTSLDFLEEIQSLHQGELHDGEQLEAHCGFTFLTSWARSSLAAMLCLCVIVDMTELVSVPPGCQHFFVLEKKCLWKREGGGNGKYTTWCSGSTECQNGDRLFPHCCALRTLLQ